MLYTDAELNSIYRNMYSHSGDLIDPRYIEDFVFEKKVVEPVVILKESAKVFKEKHDVKKCDINEITILLIPDAHVFSETNFDRFIALNNYIMDKKPDYIVQLGDFMSMDCISHWNKFKKLKMEGSRYKKEIEAGNTAIDLMFNGISKSKSYNPEIVWCFGNHDQDWVEKYIEANPTLYGHIDLIEDLKLKQRGIKTIIPFKKYYEINGILFTHAPINAAGACVSGKFSCQKASELVSKSLVFGHCHNAALFSTKRHGDERDLQIYTAGCFFEPNEIQEYAEDSTMTHSFGITMLTSSETGQFDVNFTSLERLKRLYL